MDFPCCIHNRNVYCLDPSQCDHCGWDPDVYQARMHRILNGIKADRDKRTVMILHARMPAETALNELRAIWHNVRVI